MSEEPLQYLPVERWGELQRVFRKDWTRGVSGYAVLDTQRRWLANGMETNLKIYCPYGDMQNGMVAFNEKDSYYEIIIQCPSDDTSKLATALRTTKLIDWKKSVKVPFAPRNVVNLLYEIMDDVKIEVEEVFPYDTHILDTTELYKDVRLPDGVTFKHLTTEHLNLIDSTWPYNYPSSDTYFEFLINLKYGYGLYLNNDLISWVLISEAGTLLHLYTVEEHRRKGYAEVLLKMVSNDLLKDGRVVIAYCVPDNYNASKLYIKAGFVPAEDVTWIYFRSK
uniref:SFRICE_001209 n=1 Tax=Spodoptera frugiperda TaxID=7108 RepID=A0A2H1VJT3_SPOFR